MVTDFVAFILSAVVGATLTLVVRNRAHAWGWFDQTKSSRKIHARPIPRLGGVAIVLGTFAPLTALLVVDSGVGLIFRAEHALVLGLFVGGLAITALGLYDDLRGANARVKFVVQFAVALWLYAIGFRVEQIANPFGQPFQLGWLALPFTLLWMVGVVNAMNLIDGLDGLAGGVALFGVGTNFALAVAHGDVLMCLVMAALGGAILGFLLFNFNPASIFMGDTGSMFLGFVLAATSIKVNTKSGTAVAMAVPILSLGLPIMDTLLAMARRALLGRPLFSADKEHIHHRMLSRLGVSHRQAVLLLYGLCCLFALTALGLSYANSAQSAMLLLAMSVVVAVLMRKLGYLSPERTFEVAEVRKRNQRLRTAVRDLSAWLGQCSSIEATWEVLRPLADAVEAAKLELRLQRDGEGHRDETVFQTEREEAGSGFPVGLRLPLGGAEHPMGTLTVIWKDGRLEVNRDEELACEVVADQVSGVLQRLVARSSADPERVVALRR
jgi:UDP-GlcNAc:undecaprenyl-phosphate GlcNAc-1-phosphate transferase